MQQKYTFYFTCPDQESCTNYFIEKGQPIIESEKFFDYYTSNRWITGKVKMKDWKAAARNWIRNIKTTEPEKKKLEYQKNAESYNGYL